jgi:hypothetical protein
MQGLDFFPCLFFYFFPSIIQFILLRVLIERLFAHLILGRGLIGQDPKLVLDLER